MMQATLFESDLDLKFEQYHRDNPHIYDLFRTFTFRAMHSGKKKYSARAIFHRIRWEMQVETRDIQGFKLNNNYTSRYVRLFEKEYPEHIGFFEKRELRS